MRIIVSLSALCEAASFTYGNSYAKEYALLQQSPYPYHEIMALQKLQKLCLTILRLAKHRPQDRIHVPIVIWRRLNAHTPVVT